MEEDPAELFKRLNDELYSHIDQQYFQEPRDFKSLVEVLNVLESRVDQIIYQNRVAATDGDGTASYEAGNSLNDLQKQLEIVKRVIEDVVTFQQGGMNNSLDTMREVVKEYCRGREEIQRLRKSLAETQTVLTAKKTGQISLRELWLKKAELRESLRLVRDIEELKNVPHKVFRLMQQRRYYAAVLTLNSAVEKMFSEDLVGVGGLVQIRETIMDLKENLLEACVQELKEQIVGPMPDFQFAAETQDTSETASNLDYEAQSDFGGGTAGAAGSVVGGSAFHGTAGSSYGENVRRTSYSQSLSEFAPSRPAGSVSGDSPNIAQQVFNSDNGMSGTTVGLYGLWPQYRDLKEVDDHVEAALVDPPTAGPVYMRLLVKTVGALKCEEDVERLIFETIFSRFQAFVVQARELVFKRRQDHWLTDEHLQNATSQDYDDTAWQVRDGKAFTQFVGALLESTSGIISRLMYIWTLLTINRQVREGKIDVANSNGTCTVIDVPIAERKKARQCVLSVWHDLEDKVWIEIFRHLADPEILKISDAPATTNGNAKRLGPNNGNEAQKLSVAQLADYQRTDLTMIGGSMPDRMGDQQNLLEDGEESKFASDKLLLFHPSSSHSAAVYHKVMSYQSIMQRIFKDYGLDTVFFGGSGEANTAASQPSPATKVPVNPFSTTLKVTSQPPPQTILQMTRTQDAQRKLQEDLLSHVTEPLQAFLESELIPIIQSSVNEDMRAMQIQPAEYFKPRSGTSGGSSGATGGNMNGSNMHNTSNNRASENLSHQSSSSHAGHNTPASGSIVVTRHTTIHVAPCLAAERSLFHADALVRYWQQLSQHRTMVSVVLDRLLRGYAAAAKDHVENLTWNWQSQLLTQQDKNTTKQMLSMLEEDVVYAQYYTQRVFQGKMSLDELLMPVSFASSGIGSSNSGSLQNSTVARSALLSGDSSSSFSGLGSFANAQHRSLAQYFWQEILALHQGALWEFAGRGQSGAGSNSGYILTEAKALSPLSQGGMAIAGVACVMAASDWLIYRITTVYNTMMRKVMLANHSYTGSHGSGHHGHGHTTHRMSTTISNRRPSAAADLSSIAGGSSFTSSNRNNNTLASGNTAIEQMQEIKDSLCLALKEVQRLSKTALLFLRHSIQTICFLYLQKLVHINFNIGGGNGGNNSNNGGNSAGSETVAEDSVLSALMQQLHNMVNAVSLGYVLSFSGSSVIPSIVGPIVCLVPRLLLRCITAILQIGPASAAAGGVSSGAKVAPINKTRLLRLVVSAQQLLVSFFNHKLTISDGESKRRLLEVLSEESERVRKIASLIEAPASEIRQYFKKVFDSKDLDKETARSLWLRASERAGEGSFDEVWRDLELSHQQTHYNR